MEENIPNDPRGGVSDPAVRAKTGKSWEEWFELLDQAQARESSHQDIVLFLRRNHAINPWWQQMIATAYRQEHGQQEEDSTSSGLQVESSKTLAVPLATLFGAWFDEDTRDRWLPHSTIVVRKISPGRAIHFIWEDGQSTVDVHFQALTSDKSQVSLRHSKLSDTTEAQRMQAFWSENLQRLKIRLESGT